MESRLIYAVVNSLKSNITWIKQSQTEWIYVGLQSELKSELINNKIKATFANQNIYLILGRSDSLEISRDNILVEILTRMGKEDILICDMKFSKFIEFNKLGIMRIGSKTK